MFMPTKPFEFIPSMILHSTPEFKREMDHRCQALVSKLETVDTITFIVGNQRLVTMVHRAFEVRSQIQNSLIEYNRMERLSGRQSEQICCFQNSCLFGNLISISAISTVFKIW